MYLSEEIQKKWSPVLEHPDLGEIKDSYRKAVTAIILENQEKALQEEKSIISEAVHANNMSSAVDTYDPILISLVRRALPNLMAYDVCGVQPMTGPTGLIFAMKSHYTSQTGTEALFNEADTDFAGTGTHAGSNPVDGSYTTGTGVTRDNAELFGDTVTLNQMAFSIEKTTVTAKSRALKAEYTVELAQDLKAVHGLDAESELSNILSQEILAEINREVIRTIYKVAKTGAASTASAGTFDLDVDSNGRWSVERFKGLLFNIERDANVIAQDTRRGKGNFIICSSDVASALSMAGVLDYAPALDTNLNVDDTGNTFAGVLNGRYKVYIDPFAANQVTNYMIVGYKGSSPYDAGIFYCPYVPLQMVRAIGEDNFQPRIGFKTRYGMVANPFAAPEGNAGAIDRTGSTKNNVYYRLVKVKNLM